MITCRTFVALALGFSALSFATRAIAEEPLLQTLDIDPDSVRLERSELVLPAVATPANAAHGGDYRLRISFQSRPTVSVRGPYAGLFTEHREENSRFPTSFKVLSRYLAEFPPAPPDLRPVRSEVTLFVRLAPEGSRSVQVGEERVTLQMPAQRSIYFNNVRYVVEKSDATVRLFKYPVRPL